MDTRRLILAMALSFAVLYGWTYYTQKYLKPPAATSQPASPAASSQPAGTQAIGSSPASAAWQAEATSQPSWHVQAGPAAQAVTLGLDDPEGNFGIQAFLTSQGAAVERVLIVQKQQRKTKSGKLRYQYAASVAGKEPYPVLEPLELPNGQKEFSWQTASIRIGTPEVTVPLAHVPWNVETRTTESGAFEAKFWVDILQGDKPVVRVIKRFSLAPQSFAMNMDLTFQSLNQQEVTLVVNQLGSVGIRREDPRSDFRKIFLVANSDGKAKPTIYQHAGLAKNGPAEVGSALPIWWTALVDKYFAAITTPDKAVGAPGVVSSARVFTYTPDAQVQDRGGDIAVQLVSPEITASPTAPARLSYDLYVGPKSSAVFAANPTYTTRNYSILQSAEYAWCTFSSLGEVLTGFLHFLYQYMWPHNYGLAIIILVLLVRLILHPLTKYQQISMAQMQAKQATVQPKVAAVKAKFPNDKQKQQLETMRIYREAGINPASQAAGCLPMVIQLPIWVALYSALNYDINLWHEPFAFWIRDLSAPDAMFSWATPINIPLLSFLIGPLTKFNLLPIFLAIGMYLQQKYTPKAPIAPGTAPEVVAQQQQMQKMMGFMMIFMGTLFYNMPSGLNLYIMASSFFGVLEQKRIRKHMEDRKNQVFSNEPPKQAGWITRLMAMMEKKATESRTIRKDKQD
jgi:YidC/Oxa1 family membrane protein insertase